MDSDLNADLVKLDGKFSDLATKALDALFDNHITQVELTLEDFSRATRVLTPEELIVWCAIIEISEAITYSHSDEPMVSFLISECAPASFSNTDLPKMIENCV